MSSLAKGPLTTAETEFLAQCEETISAGLMTWVEVAQALTSIRDNRLYRIDHATFEDYCAKRWHISRPRAYELMGAAAVVSAIADTGAEPPTNEAQARELRRVPEEQREAVWQKALETTDGKPTAAAVREVAKGVANTDTPADGPATPDQPADRPAEAAVPAPVAAGGAVGAAPSAPSPLEQYLAADPTLARTGWQKNFAGALAKSIGIVSFTPDQIAEYADRQLVDELRRLVSNLDNYATRAEKAWHARNGGLRVIEGGAA